MRLLIVTQAVDQNDSNLGFFHRWIEEFAKHCEKVTVICLREGERHLPGNVEVLSLGKEKGTSRLTRLVRFYRYIISRRDDYDAAFVHMNPEYVVLGGALWRLWNKKIVLWYTHKSVDLKLRVAALFANDIATASKESFRLKSNKVHVMGHGIDTNFFSPDPNVMREEVWLSAGRLDKSKRHDLAIRAAAEADKPLRILGDGPEQSALESLGRELGVSVTFLGPQNHAGVRDAFLRASLFLHMSETGSLDKMVLEAIACGCPVRTNDLALKYLEHETPAYVREYHSLQKLIPRILSLYEHK